MKHAAPSPRGWVGYILTTGQKKAGQEPQGFFQLNCLPSSRDIVALFLSSDSKETSQACRLVLALDLLA